MNTKLRTISLLLIVSLALFGGCSKKANTPREAVENMQDALVEKDKDDFLACFDLNENTKQQEKILVALFDIVAATVTLEEEMQKEYGSWKVSKLGSPHAFDSLRDKKWLRTAKVEIHQDHATIIPAGRSTQKPIKLIRKKKQWLIKVEGFGPTVSKRTAREIDIAIKLLSRITDAIKYAQTKVGKKGYSAKRIYAELEEELKGIINDYNVKIMVEGSGDSKIEIKKLEPDGKRTTKDTELPLDTRPSDSIEIIPITPSK